MVKESKMTIEKLGRMVARGFSSVEEKMAAVEEKMATKEDLASAERRLTAKIEAVDEKVDVLEEVDIRGLHHRVSTLEKAVKHLKPKHG